MIEFGISVVLIALLIAAVVFFKKRKECSSCCPSKQPPKSESKDPEQVKQQQETKLTDKPIVNAESISINPEIIEDPVVVPEPKPEANQPAAVQPSAKQETQEATVSTAEDTLDRPLLPQDSVLKRHYLTHVCAMIESLAPPRPTDSVLCRHYDSVIAAEIGLCLSDKKAMEQLIHDYENNK